MSKKNKTILDVTGGTADKAAEDSKIRSAAAVAATQPAERPTQARKTRNAVAETIGIANFDTRLSVNDFGMPRQEVTFDSEIQKLLFQESLNAAYNRLCEKINLAPTDEEKRSICELEGALAFARLLGKYLSPLWDSLYQDHKNWEVKVFKMFDESFGKLLTKQVRQRVFSMGMELACATPPENAPACGNAILLSITEGINSASYEPSTRISSFVESEFGQTNPLVVNPKSLAYPIAVDKKIKHDSYRASIKELEDLCSQDLPEEEQYVARELLEIFKASKTLGNLVIGQTGILIRKALSQGRMNQEELATALKSINEFKIPFHEDLLTLISRAEEAGINADGVQNCLFKQCLFLDQKFANFIAQLLINNVAEYHELEPYLPLQTKTNLLRTIASLDNMEWDDYVEMCKAMQDRIKKLEGMVQNTSFLGKLFGRNRARLRQLAQRCWDKVCLPQLVAHGEMLFSETFMLPGPCPIPEPDAQQTTQQNKGESQSKSE